MFVGIVVGGELLAGGILDSEVRVENEAERKGIEIDAAAFAFLGGEGKSVDVAGPVDAGGHTHRQAEFIRGGIGVIGLALGDLGAGEHGQAEWPIHGGDGQDKFTILRDWCSD